MSALYWKHLNKIIFISEIFFKNGKRYYYGGGREKNFFFQNQLDKVFIQLPIFGVHLQMLMEN